MPRDAGVGGEREAADRAQHPVPLPAPHREPDRIGQQRCHERHREHGPERHLPSLDQRTGHDQGGERRDRRAELLQEDVAEDDGEAVAEEIGHEVAHGGDCRTGAPGFFQFGGLAPGTYAVEVQQPGYPALRSSPIRVDPGLETLIREPTDPPAAFCSETRDPAPSRLAGQALARASLQARRASACSARFRAVWRTRAGSSPSPAKPAGQYRVSVLDSLGNSLYSGEHSVDGADSAPQSIEVHFVTVEGDHPAGRRSFPGHPLVRRPLRDDLLQDGGGRQRQIPWRSSPGWSVADRGRCLDAWISDLDAGRYSGRPRRQGDCRDQPSRHPDLWPRRRRAGKAACPEPM